ncbi:MAG: nucleotidyltransferase family protein [Planctomycetota bacterium]
MTLDTIKTSIKANLAQFREEYGLVSIGIFGSQARGDAGRSSDVDILVEFARPIGMFRFLELEERLSDLLNAKVDLVTRKALKPNIGRRILAEVRMI